MASREAVLEGPQDNLKKLLNLYLLLLLQPHFPL